MNVSRRQWGARRPRTKPAPMRLPAPDIYVHHAGVPFTGTTLAQEKAQMRALQRYHMQRRGYDDIAYSFVIFPSGNVHAGRGWGVVGAHTKGRNARGHGICFAGDMTEQRPTRAALATFVRVVRWGRAHGKIGAGELLGHRETPSGRKAGTECPGKHLTAKLDSLRRSSS